MELVDVDGKNVYVKMTGACAGCQMAAITLDGIQQRIVEDLGEFVRVMPAELQQLSGHATGDQSAADWRLAPALQATYMAHAPSRDDSGGSKHEASIQ